ncbi:hypothetical protein D3C78_653090 [compost metagenome]
MHLAAGIRGSPQGSLAPFAVAQCALGAVALALQLLKAGQQLLLGARQLLQTLAVDTPFAEHQAFLLEQGDEALQGLLLAFEVLGQAHGRISGDWVEGGPVVQPRLSSSSSRTLLISPSAIRSARISRRPSLIA